MKNNSALRFFTILSLFFCNSLPAQNVGIGVPVPLSKLHINGGLLADGTFGSTPVSGAGTRLMWIPAKAAFRAGFVSDVNWDTDSIGIYSFAAGWNTKAKGNSAIALGAGAKATGNFSIGIGNGSTASGDYSLATGTVTNATGNYSTSMGYGSNASGEGSIATGKSYALGKYSASFGDQTFAAGTNTATFGIGSIADGYNSTAMGNGTTSRAFASFTIGTYNNDLQFPDKTTPASTDRVFEIGNGTAEANRRNAITLLRNGKMGIGTTNPYNILHVYEGSSGLINNGFPGVLIERNANTYLTFLTPDANESGIIFGNSLNVDGAIIYNNTVFPQDAKGLQFRTNGNATRMVIYSNGNAWLQGTLTQNSDARLKKDIKPIKNAAEKISKLSGYHYHWKASDAPAGLQTGLLAQEVQKVFPELVSENSGGNLGVNYSGIIPYLLQAVKEQQKQISQLQHEIKYLKKKRK